MYLTLTGDCPYIVPHTCLTLTGDHPDIVPPTRLTLTGDISLAVKAQKTIAPPFERHLRYLSNSGAFVDDSASAVQISLFEVRWVCG